MKNDSYKIISINGETVAAEPIGLDTYKLLENPVFSCQINYGTIVQALPSKNGKIEMVKVVRASEFLTRQLLTSYQLIDDKFSSTIGKKIVDAGGSWETAMGGVLFIHIPRNSEFDLEASLKEVNMNLMEVKE